MNTFILEQCSFLELSVITQWVIGCNVEILKLKYIQERREDNDLKKILVINLINCINDINKQKYKSNR